MVDFVVVVIQTERIEPDWPEDHWKIGIESDKLAIFSMWSIYLSQERIALDIDQKS